MKRRTVICLVLLGAVLILLCAGVITFFAPGPLSHRDSAYYDHKYAPPESARRPSPRPAAFVPEKQIELHTCGFHSLSSMYTAYGLDPGAARLRFRLGTDVPANLLAPDSTGTIHPDILRVLGQDGFRAEVLYDRAAFASRLRIHLEAGNPAMLLVTVNSWHWVLACGVREDNLVICDSLEPALYEEPIEVYASTRIHNVILVRPETE